MMDRMFWFGWLFKGRLEVSLFDTIMLIAEIGVALITFGVLMAVGEKVQSWFRGTKP